LPAGSGRTAHEHLSFVKRNPRQFITTAAVTAAESRLSGIAVKPHPQGGWTLAESKPGSTISIYHGSYPSPSAARTALTKWKVALINDAMKGNRVVPIPTDQQMSLLPRREWPS
jgi:hypothetical protein